MYINTTDDEGDGHAVVNIEYREWLHYTINQADAGTYDVKFRVSNDLSSKIDAVARPGFFSLGHFI